MDTVLASNYVQAHTYAYSRLARVYTLRRSYYSSGSIYIYIYYNVIMSLYLLARTIVVL